MRKRLIGPMLAAALFGAASGASGPGTAHADIQPHPIPDCVPAATNDIDLLQNRGFDDSAASWQLSGSTGSQGIDGTYEYWNLQATDDPASLSQTVCWTTGDSAAAVVRVRATAAVPGELVISVPGTGQRATQSFVADSRGWADVVVYLYHLGTPVAVTLAVVSHGGDGSTLQVRSPVLADDDTDPCPTCIE